MIIRLRNKRKQYQIIYLCLLVLVNTFLFSNCEENNNLDQISSIFYQEFDIDTTVYNIDTLIYDINGDMIPDLKVTRSILIGVSEVDYEGSFSGIENTMMFCYTKTVPNMEMLEKGDEIYNYSRYNWIDKIRYSGSTPYFSENHYWATAIFTDYFGFQIEIEHQLYYGWFRFKHFELEEIGFNTMPGQSIKVGQKE